jgi:ABC-type lipoprotein release transport system permease subunit
VGVEPEVEARHSPLPRRVVAGTWLGGAASDAVPRVMVGALLAERLGLAPDRKLVLTTNDAAGQLTETLVRVQGIFRTGAEDVDGYLVLAPLEAARRVFGLEPDAATQLGVLLDEPDDAPAVARAIRAAIPEGDVAVLRWQEVLPDLAAFIRIDRTSDTIFQAMLLFLILFTIFNTLLMSVLERTREFAVQLALGTPPRLLRLQLLLESMLLGILGCTLGTVVGGGVALWVEAHGWDLRGLYREGLTVSGFAVDTLLRAHPTPRLVLGLAGVVFVATLLASLAPMRRAVRVRLVEVLR